jgi:hypothetical protein
MPAAGSASDCDAEPRDSQLAAIVDANKSRFIAVLPSFVMEKVTA